MRYLQISVYYRYCSSKRRFSSSLVKVLFFLYIRVEKLIKVKYSLNKRYRLAIEALFL